MPEETGTAQGFAGPEEVVTISVEPSNTISVDKRQITLSKARGHRATWRIQGGTTFNILFDGDSPFDQKRYDQNTAKSLKPRANAREDTYKYIVQRSEERRVGKECRL